MLNQILFGMPLIKYTLNNKSFKSLEKASFKYLLYFYILQSFFMKPLWPEKPNSSIGDERLSC